MRVALLNERITILKSSFLIDKIGNHQNIWQTYYSCYATISNESPLEQTSSGNIWDESKIDFTLRYSSEIASISSVGYRIEFHKALYEIIGIDHMNYKKKSVKLHCKRCER